MSEKNPPFLHLDKKLSMLEDCETYGFPRIVVFFERGKTLKRGSFAMLKHNIA